MNRVFYNHVFAIGRAQESGHDLHIHYFELLDSLVLPEQEKRQQLENKR